MKWQSLPSPTWVAEMSRLIRHEEDLNLSQEAIQKLVSFARGDITWAEAEGMTWEQAKAIGQVGCDLAEAGRLEEARILFEGLIAGNPRDSASQAALGTVYQKLGRIQDAKEAYTQTLDIDSDNPIALTYRGELRLREGDQAGREDIERAAKSDRSESTAAGRRARTLIAAMSTPSA